MFKRKSDKKDKPAKAAKPKKSKKTKAAKPKKEKKPRVKSDIVVQKPDTDVYTVMLIIAFIGILTACLLLYIELSRYGSYPWWKA